MLSNRKVATCVVSAPPMRMGCDAGARPASPLVAKRAINIGAALSARADVVIEVGQSGER